MIIAKCFHSISHRESIYFYLYMIVIFKYFAAHSLEQVMKFIQVYHLNDRISMMAIGLPVSKGIMHIFSLTKFS